jgi:hypothetical protein
LSSSSTTNISVTVGGTTKSVTNAYAKFGVGTYTGNGGEQRPSYIGSGLVRWNMMRATTTYFNSAAYSGYCDWMMMDTYTGSDVPYVTMIGVLKAATPHAYIASGSKGDSSGKWNILTLLDSNNSSVSGGGSTWGSSITVKINGTSKTLTIPSSPTDTKNTAGSTNSTNKLFLIGATSQATNPQTYSNSSVFTQSGSLYATHFYENSDITLKTNIKNINTSDNIPILKEFDWKSDGTRGYGLIAQELEEQGYSELVSVKDDGYKTVNYSAALSLIVGKLQVKIRELEKEIEILKSKN